MNTLFKVACIYLLVVGSLVGVHFIITPLYTDWGGFAPDDIWGLLNFFIVLGLLVSIVTTGQSAFQDSHYGSAAKRGGLLFFASLAIAVAFLHNLAAHLTGTGNEQNELYWKLVDPAVVFLFVAVGFRLWSRDDASAGDRKIPNDGQKG